MITWNELENCLAEADRFMKKARAAQERLKLEWAKIDKADRWRDWNTPSSETAAVKRARLDLIMALRKLRKPV